MRARLLLAVLIGLWTSVAVKAEPVNAPVHKAEQPVEQTAPIIVASAAETPVEAAKVDKADPRGQAKPRRARVTTCRCGDQTPNDD